MDFKDQLSELAARVAKQKNQIATEEADAIIIMNRGIGFNRYQTQDFVVSIEIRR
jgi:hypothetical protein